jgi:hypothetical protein
MHGSDSPTIEPTREKVRLVHASRVDPGVNPCVEALASAEPATVDASDASDASDAARIRTASARAGKKHSADQPEKSATLSGFQLRGNRHPTTDTTEAWNGKARGPKFLAPETVGIGDRRTDSQPSPQEPESSVGVIRA